MKNGGTNLHTTIQESILALISHQHFNAALPPLTDATWAAILTPSPTRDMHNERLEFLGDALMYATIGRLLLAQIPDGSPHLYTCIRGALHSNRTFSRLAEKLDILAVSDSVLKALTLRTFGEGNPARLKNKPETKATADLFETIIAAYYLDRGFEALCEWVNDIYTPLIDAANAAFCAR
ncbi:ribonuclease III [Obba rivulosa]|uniref:Ribonuclease III n=1 Tax=Obba rivulosa TaxID=1052685 RepID=A0A8E2DUJ4_9APHY|nr:ribonuclease III [Obba rivulosa]